MGTKKLSETLLEEETKSLEWTLYTIGIFLDYYGMPHLKSHLAPFTFAIDIANNMAGIPGDGNQLMSTAYSGDVAKFVVASLDLEKWEKISYIVGEKFTFNELVKRAEKARGTKFKVTYDSVEQLQQGKITELPGHANLYAAFSKEGAQQFLGALGSFYVNGIFDLPTDKTLNSKLPQIKVMTLDDVLELWKGK